MKKVTLARVSAALAILASLIAILNGLGLRPSALVAGKAKATKHKQTKHAKQAAPATSSTPREKAIDGAVAPAAGAWQHHTGKVVLAGRVFEGYGTLTSASPSVTFDVRGWETFTCSVGVNDSHATPAPEFDVALEVDGQSLEEKRFKEGQRPETFQITLRGHRAVTLRCVRALNADGSAYQGELTDLVFAEPKLTAKGG